MKIKKSIAIIGGGYTGIGAAIKLLDDGYEIYLIEKLDFIGGLGHTLTLSNGFQCESYYHHFFTKDKYLLDLSRRFLNLKPSFVNTKMAIFQNGTNYPWNGLNDLFRFPLINIFQKIRFIFATVLLSSSFLKPNILDKESLSSGMLKLYGKKCFRYIWEPILRGKFGEKSFDIPLRWMSGRLKQRLESRVNGKETLGFIPGSIQKLTNKVEKHLNKSENSFLLKETIVKSLAIDHKSQSIIIKINSKKNNSIKELKVDKVLFTTPSSVANNLKIKDSNKNISWNNHKYFRAYCILLELRESLSDFYWTNINDKNIFFCGYIEQTQLTGTEEYGGYHIGYLTKYVSKDQNKLLSKKKLIELSYQSLYKLFPNRDIDSIINNIHVSKSNFAQVVNDFNFRKVDTYKYARKNIYVVNMSNLYPKERSINNAIEIGVNIARKIK